MAVNCSKESTIPKRKQKKEKKKEKQKNEEKTLSINTYVH